MDFTKFRTLDMKLLDRVDKMLSDDIAKLMVKKEKCRQKQKSHSTFQAMVPLEEQMGREKGTDKIEGGAFSGVNIVQFYILIILGGDYFVVNVNSELQVMDAQTPFMFKGGEGINAGQGEVEWVVAKERQERT